MIISTKSILVSILVLCIYANLSLAEDDCKQKLPADDPRSSSGYNVGVRCGGLSGNTCVGFTGIISPFNCGDTPEGCNVPEYPLPGYNGLWIYDYSYVDGLLDGYGNYPGGCYSENVTTGIWEFVPKYTAEEYQTITDAANATNLFVRVEINGTECSISALSTINTQDNEVDFQTCNSCSLVGCEGFGQPCDVLGCGEGALEGPLAVRYDCTNLQMGNRVGIEFGMSDPDEGCADLLPVFYPFLEDTSEAPVGQPTDAPVESTSAPTNAVCADAPATTKFDFVNNGREVEQRSCRFIRNTLRDADKPKQRRRVLCEEEATLQDQTKQKIWSLCSRACQVCPDQCKDKRARFRIDGNPKIRNCGYLEKRRKGLRRELCDSRVRQVKSGRRAPLSNICEESCGKVGVGRCSPLLKEDAPTDAPVLPP